MRRAPPLRFVLALLLWFTLAALTARDLGVVGEVAAAWALPEPPTVIVEWQGQAPVFAKDHAWGPLRANAVRPTERLVLGDHALPLAVNSYTGGLADWPARAVYALSGSLRAVVALNLLLGALLIALVYRFLRFHGSPGAAPIAALLLATDWSFLFYRKVLGGTETLLLAATLLMLWSFWSRRWAGGRHGTHAFAAGLGLGLLAKATFLATAGAMGLAILATRWDRPRVNAPPPPRWLLLAAIPLALTAPLWITWIHQGVVQPTAPEVLSHDQLGLQLDRALSGLGHLFSGDPTPARETTATLRWFLLDPLAWFEAAYGGQAPANTALRLAGWSLALFGSAAEWRQRSNSPSGALLRFMSIFAPLQVLALWLANRDMHHLAQATPTLLIWAALALDRVASMMAGARSLSRVLYGFALLGPLALAGLRDLAATDSVLAGIQAPMFTAHGQSELRDALRGAADCTVRTADYDLYGSLEVLVPERRFEHAWGVASVRFPKRAEALAELLAGSRGDCFLAVRPSAPMIYNLDASEAGIARAAESAGVRLTLDFELRDADGAWARLYRVQ